MPFLTILLLSLFLSASSLVAQSVDTQAVWTTVNIGNPLLGGGSSALPCQPISCPGIAIQTSAAGWAATDDGRTDEVTFVYRPLIDDGAVIVRIEPSGFEPAATGGLSVRVGLGASSAAVSLVVSSSGQLLLHNRTQAGGVTQSWLVGTTSQPSWLKLERRGTTIDAFYSQDGTQWTSVGRGLIPSAQTVYIGMVGASENSNAMLTVGATSLRTERLSSLPTGWNAVTVGAVAGSLDATSYLNGFFGAFSSSGTIGGASDHFGFTYLRVTGDAEIVARVVSPGGTTTSEAGVMARESLDPDAAHLFAGVAAPNTRVTKRRISPGLPATAGSTRSVSLGWWLKLVRRGTMVETFESADGGTWTPVSSDTLPLPSTFLLGLAFASGSGNALGVFDQVSVRALAANKPPVVAIDAPSPGTAVVAGGSLTLSASASDPDDRVSAVEFYVDGTRIGTDTAMPYQTTWAGAQAGTRVLTAVAIDSEGARTTSAPVTVVVSAPPSSTGSSGPPPSGPATWPAGALPPTGTTTPDPVIPPIYIPPVIPPLIPPVIPPLIPPLQTAPVTRWQLQFTPSADHYQNVDRYVLQVFKSDLISLAFTLDLGLPAVTSGLCTVDVSSPLAALVAGNYVVSVRAVDDNTGLSSPAATAAFTR